MVQHNRTVDYFHTIVKVICFTHKRTSLLLHFQDANLFSLHLEVVFVDTGAQLLVGEVTEYCNDLGF
jgi:hypothetical protein